MPFLLDSNAVIDLMEGHQQLVAAAERQAPGTVIVSSIVMYELLYGAFISRLVDANLNRLAALAFPIVAFDVTDAREAGRLRALLKASGTTIGPYDVMIAGQALARGLTVVTHNTAEFARVPGLNLQDWRA